MSLLTVDVTSKRISLSSKPTSMQDCTHRINVELGEHVGSRVESTRAIAPRNYALDARQSSTPIPSAGNTQILSGTPTVSYSILTPTESASGPTATSDLSFSLVNTPNLIPNAKYVCPYF